MKHALAMGFEPKFTYIKAQAFCLLNSMLDEARPHWVFTVWHWKYISYSNYSHFSLKALSSHL